MTSSVSVGILDFKSNCKIKQQKGFYMNTFEYK